MIRLSSVSPVALDSNILISAFNAYTRPNPIGIRAQKLLEEIKTNNITVFISVLVFEEFLVKIYKMKLERNLYFYEQFFTSSGLYEVIDINRQIARAAAKIRADYPSIRAPDAIHLASAIQSNAKIFYTTDKRLPKKIGKLEIRTA